MPNKKLKGGLGVNAHGFDEAWVYYGGGADYFTRRTVQGRGPVSWWHNREYRPQDVGYTEDLITGHVLDFIRENKDRPFFCYVPFHIVHAPLQAKDSDLEGVDAKVTDKTKRVYAAMVQAMDKNVAAILAELDKLGLRDNTIVVFTSDNGATRDGSNLPFRGGKHTLFEGGTRLPTVIHWPKGKLAGGTWDGLCGALDMFPTLMAMAGLEMPATRPLDGKNIWPALRDNGRQPGGKLLLVVAQRGCHPHGGLAHAPLLRPRGALRYPQGHRRNRQRRRQASRRGGVAQDEDERLGRVDGRGAHPPARAGNARRQAGAAGRSAGDLGDGHGQGQAQGFSRCPVRPVGRECVCDRLHRI